MNICRACGEDFQTLAAFDEHRTGVYDYTYSEGVKQTPVVEDGRRCFTVAELLEHGWWDDKDGRWTFPRNWDKQGYKWDHAVPEGQK